MAPTSKALAIIAGVGPGTGASVARKFAETYPVVLLTRNPANYEPLITEIEKSGGSAWGISTDVTSEASVTAAFDKIKELAKDGVAAGIFNVSGGFSRKPFLEVKLAEWEAGHETNSRGAFLFAQHILPLLQSTVSQSPIYPPTLIFTGATASTKGSALFAPFAAGKFAQKALAQSLAREFGPKGVHVGHVVIDGVIDIPRTKEWKVSDHPDSKISPEGIAAEYWHLHTQNRTAWAFEVDLRPWVEKW